MAPTLCEEHHGKVWPWTYILAWLCHSPPIQPHSYSRPSPVPQFHPLYNGTAGHTALQTCPASDIRAQVGKVLQRRTARWYCCIMEMLLLGIQAASSHVPASRPLPLHSVGGLLETSCALPERPAPTGRWPQAGSPSCCSFPSWARFRRLASLCCQWPQSRAGPQPCLGPAPLQSKLRPPVPAHIEIRRQFVPLMCEFPLEVLGK